jgi:hypothetical protein
MKKSFIVLSVFCALALSSCKISVIPKAINTVNAVSLDEMNLQRKDYSVLKTISADAVVTYKQNGSRKITVQEAGGDFKFVYKYHGFGKNGFWSLDVFSGVARLGYLDNDYIRYDTYVADEIKPEFMARAIATYRLINACKVAGGDGVIEPIVSTNVEQSGFRTVTYKTTVSAKIIKLHTDSK